MSKIRIGIIGCGGIAFGKHLSGLSKCKDAELAAFCDIITERAEKAKKEYGSENSLVYSDYKELLKNPDIDVVHVCTPNREHSFITVDALEAGKDVYCEKPMAINYEEALKMYEASERTGRLLTIGYQNRQTDENLFAKEICKSGRLGDIYYAKTLAVRRRAVPNWGVFLNDYEQGGGPLIDIATHALDLTLWMTENYEPEMCVGRTFRKLADSSPENQGNCWGAWDPEKYKVEDSAFAFVTMKNGAVINLESSWALNLADPKEATFALCGTKGGIDTFDGVRINFIDGGRQVIEKPDLNAGGAAYFDGVKTSATELDMHRWLKAVETKTKPCVLPEQALTVTKILDGIYKSAESGRPYYF